MALTRRAWFRDRRLVERAVWFAVAALVAGRFLYFSTIRGTSFAFTEFYPEVVTAAVLIVFPFVYDLTFGRLPFESVRRRRLEARLRPELDAKSPTTDGEEAAAALRELARDRRVPIARALILLRAQAVTSRRIADSLYTRSGVYLIIGALIAFLGLAFFYTQTTIEQRKDMKTSETSVQTSPTQSAAETLTLRAAELVPRFGILFFIELIAFFFLRQYRSALDEFRHFEAVKRRREELMVLVHLLQEPTVVSHVTQLVASGNFFSTAGKLSAGETTEVIETRKLQKDELELFEKIVEAIRPAK